MRAALILSLTLCTSPAWAQDADDPRWDGGHYALAGVSAAGGSVVGGAAGGLLICASGDCEGFTGIGLLLLGIAGGSLAGGGTGAWLYGTLRDFDGAWWAATGGWILGVAGGGLVAWGCNSISAACGNATPFLLVGSASAGAAWGYTATLPTDQAPGFSALEPVPAWHGQPERQVSRRALTLNLFNGRF
jgi:hypothetical protein